MKCQYKCNLCFSLAGCLGWILCIFWINFGGNVQLTISFLVCAFVFIDRARQPNKTAIKLKNVEFLLASILGLGLYYSLNDLIGFDVLVFAIFTNKAVAISSTILLLLVPYKLVVHEKQRAMTL